MGASMSYLDVGGGLAVDYDGSKTDFHASKNYNIQEYATDVVFGIHDACTKANVPVPTIVTESGRAVDRAPVGAGLRGRGHERRALRRARAAAARLAPRPARALRHVEERRAEERAGGVPRREPGQGRGAEPLQVRLPRPPRARAGRDASTGAAARRSCRRVRRMQLRARRAPATSSACSPPSTTATSPSSSRRPTPGPSTSSSRSCRSTGSTRSRPCGRRSPI